MLPRNGEEGGEGTSRSDTTNARKGLGQVRGRCGGEQAIEGNDMALTMTRDDATIRYRLREARTNLRFRARR